MDRMFLDQTGQGVSESVLRIGIIILCKDEAGRISQCLASLAQQTLLGRDHAIEVLVVPNGCSDNTAEIAEQSRPVFDGMDGVRFRVEELAQGGKSRSWNTAVHELSDQSNDILIFLDGDIELAHDRVIEDLLAILLADPAISVVSGKPIKDTARKEQQSLVERLSLAASQKTSYSNVINGSCYIARAEVLREIWLPNDLPGEDGFLNAIVTTEGFTLSEPIENVRQPEVPTHFYAAESIRGFFHHEQRMMVGTLINRWLIEHFQQLDLGHHVGSWIRERNEANPRWVDEIVNEQVEGKGWVIPKGLVISRLVKRRNQSRRMWVTSLPIRVLAFAASLPSVLRANQVIRSRSASSYW